MNPFPSALHFDNGGMVNGRRCIVVTKRFSAITSLGLIVVYPPFVCDGGSIPKAAWSLVGDGYDEALECYVIHDALYSKNNTEFSRTEADFILKELLWNTGISRWRILAIYAAVRLFGSANFKGNPP